MEAQDNQKKLKVDVKKKYLDYPEDQPQPNEALRNYIYFEKKMNMNQVAELAGHNRQYLWGVINRKMKASWKFARKVCDILGVKEVRTLFRESDIEWPSFTTADKFSEAQK